MSRRALQMSNRKALVQRRTAFAASQARAKELEKQNEGLFTRKSSTKPPAFKELTANTGYVRETREYPSNNATGGNTEPSKRFYVNSPNLVIGQAYNKGNLVVLTRDESNDPRTGKRR